MLTSPGQPFTIPRFWNTWSNKKEEDVPKYIAKWDVINNSNIFKSSVWKISKEKYEQMLKSNPYLEELIDKLNLSPVNVEKEEKDDFDDYLIRKDLPF